MHLTRILIFSLLFIQGIAFGQMPERIPYRKGNLWGFADTSGTVVIEPTFQAVHFFSEGLAIVRKDKQYGAIDTAGKTIISFDYQRLMHFKEGKAAAMKAGKWGVIDTAGQVIAPFIHTHVKPFAEGRSAVLAGQSWCYMDENGIRVTPSKFTTAGDFKDGIAIVMTNGMYALLGWNGELVSQAAYHKIERLQNGFRLIAGSDTSVIERDNLHLLKKYIHVMPHHGNWARAALNINDTAVAWVILDTAFKSKPVAGVQWFGDFKDGLALAHAGERYGFIDTTGKLKVQARYEEASDFSNGLALTKLKKGYGYVNRRGKKVIKHRYGEARSFKHGRAAVSLHRAGYSQWGYIDSMGTAVTPADYIIALDFDGDRAIVSRYNKKGKLAWGIIDPFGEEIVGLKYEAIFALGDSAFVIGKKEKLGILDRNGKYLLPLKYDDIIPVEGNRFILVEKGRYRLVDEDFKPIDPGSYRMIKWLPTLEKYALYSENAIKLISADNSENAMSVEGTDVSEMGHPSILKYQVEDQWALYSTEGSDHLHAPEAVHYFKSIEPFRNGIARVVTEEGYGYVNEKGVLFF